VNLYPFFTMDIRPDLLLMGFIWYVAFLFSTTCHEASHALVAKWGGDETAALNGQVSLNPVPHIMREPFGMVLVPILAFLLNHSVIGWASAPYDPRWERRHPHRAAWMALAGPTANFTLMLIAAAGLRLGLQYGWFRGPSGIIGTVLMVFFQLNLLLGTFNLLPVPPLDGSAGIMLLMSETRALRYLDWLRGNSFALAGLVLAMVVFWKFYGYVQTFAVNLLFRS
jgi:Zn-dependent protease